MKIVIQKAIGDLGEMWAIEVPISNDILKSKDPVAAIKAGMYAALRVADDRLQELNLRLLDHNKVAQELDPKGLLAVRQCIQVLYGSRIRQDGSQQAPGDVKIPSEESVASGLEKALTAVDEGGR